MKKIIFKSSLVAICTVIAAAAFTGCVAVSFGDFGSASGQGDRERFDFKVSQIREICVELYCDIDYYSVASDTITLDIQPNLMEYIEVEEDGGVLTVRSSQRISTTDKNVPMLTISTPTLESVVIKGAGTFTAHDEITGEKLNLSIEGAGKANAKLDVDALTVYLFGAGSYTLSGRADEALLTLSGAGSLDALSLQTRVSDVTLEGAGSVKIACSDVLKISADGVGSVEYRGSPSMELERSGMVNIKKVD